ncbi:MAG: hypothetical protein KC485_01240, partial [Gemmatimonadetes bacterium]|nr:hypothetical protein [Gemmatimonadota bacterium]
ILDFSKIESGKMELDRVAFDPASLLEEVAEVLAVRAAAKDLELIVDVFDDVPARVIGDPNRTRQVLMNVLGNAVKYTAAGRVVVRARRLEVQDGRARVRVEIEDTGPGMPPDVVRRVFDRFYRGQLGATEGTGLGLAISHQLVQLMGGRLWVHSQPGVGSTFYLDLDWEVARAEDERRAQFRRLLQDRRAELRLADGVAAWAMARVLETVGMRVTIGGADRDPPPPDILVVDEARLDVDDPPDQPTLLLQKLGSRPLELPCTMERLAKPASKLATWQAILRLVGLGAKPEATWDLAPVDDRARGRILVVEDNVDNQRVAVSLLEKVGHQVDVAPDGEAGLAAFAAASDESGASRNAHVDARSSLLAVAEQCRDLVGVLDGLNAARYAKTPERLAAWESARNVYGPVTRSSGSDADADVATPEAPAPTTPPADEAVA